MDSHNDLEATPPSSFASEDEQYEDEPNNDPAATVTTRRQGSSKSCSQKGGLTVVAIALVLAVVVFAAALTSSLKKSKRAVSPHQIFNSDHNMIANTNIDEIVVTGVHQEEDEDEIKLEVETDIYMTSSIIAVVDEQPEEEPMELYAENENEESNDIAGIHLNYDDSTNGITLLPEDCDNDNCNNHSSNSSIEDQVSIYEGPISDFVVSNMSMMSRANNAQGASCSANRGLCKLTLTTDLYPWETSFEIIRQSNGKLVASGPPLGDNYLRKTRYTFELCLPTGEYNLQMNDEFGDGICCAHGRGKVQLMVNGKTAVETGNENYKVKRYGFSVTPERTDDNISPINNGKECSLVKPIDYTKKFQRGTGYEGFPGFQCYRTVDGTIKTVNDLLTKYPRLTSKVVLNYPTVEQELRLYALVITNKQSNNRQKGKLLTVSSIHAREIATGEMMIRFAEYLLQNYGVDPDVTWILDHTEIHIIPHANPDGRIYLEKGGEMGGWKKNRNNAMNCDHWRFGVDPNRNFPFMWGKCDDSDGSQRCSSSGDCQSIVYRGEDAKSEQETKAIVEYAASLFPVQQRKGSLQQSETQFNNPFSAGSEGVFIDIHSHGRLVGWPWGFTNKPTPNDNGLGALGRKLASFSGYRLWAPQLPNRKYGFDGSTIDTMYGWLGAASFFFELGDAFSQPCDTFSTTINEVFPALLYAAKVAKQPYTAPQGPDILCTTISSTSKSNGKYINVRMGVSDSSRTVHADDGGSLFSTGQQNVRLVEIFVNCHPFIANCRPVAMKTLSNAGRTATVSLEFKAPVDKRDNVMYIRATDSGQYTGPVTARSFVG